MTKSLLSFSPTSSLNLHHKRNRILVALKWAWIWCIFSSSLQIDFQSFKFPDFTLLFLRHMLSQKLLKVVQTCFTFNCFYFCTSSYNIYKVFFKAQSLQMYWQYNIFFCCSLIDSQVHKFIISLGTPMLSFYLFTYLLRWQFLPIESNFYETKVDWII